MTSFQILEHTADIGFRAWGETPARLFENAALALESIACDPDAAEERHVYPIAASGDGWESLLVAWLSEVLYYLDGEWIVFRRFDVERIGPDEIAGRAWGEPRDATRHPPRIVVKGVTYHRLSVRPEEGRWVAEVYLDI